MSVLIVTYNEEANIGRCLDSVAGWAGEIIVVDSFSTDRTLEICRQYTNRIYQHPFENHGKQVNWALDTVPFSCEWIFQLDADESVTPELADELCRTLPAMPAGVNGLFMKRRVHFMGRWIKHGDYYPMWLMRAFRRGKARNEEFEEDRVLLLEGETRHLANDFVDDNRKNLTFWTDKHNQWATNEARDQVALAAGTIHQVSPSSLQPSFFGNQDQRRRWIKKYLYVRTPLFVRPFVLFLYRYFIRLGFMDGVEGLIFHFLQGFWYRMLVDAKIYEMKRMTHADSATEDRVLQRG